MIQNNFSFVSIITPCRNEERFIGKCLDSIIANDYPKDKLEVLVVDGMSEDKTRQILKEYSSKHQFIKFLDNPKKITPCALNIGIKNSRGEVIMKVDAHTTYEKDYISKCVKFLHAYNASNVGGILITVPQGNTPMGKAIALAHSHPFGVGNSYFRIGSDKPRWVDTVAFGCYKKEVFEKIGLYNEDLARSQDMEFNLRLKKAGGKILLVPEIVGYYHVQSNFKAFFKHRFVDGVWAVYPMKFVKHMPVSWRHLVPFAFVLGLISSVGLSFFFPSFLWLFLSIIILYSLINVYFSIKIAAKEKNIIYLLLMPIVFATLHISYGLGSIFGAIRLLRR